MISAPDATPVHTAVRRNEEQGNSSDTSEVTPIETYQLRDVRFHYKNRKRESAENNSSRVVETKTITPSTLVKSPRLKCKLDKINKEKDAIRVNNRNEGTGVETIGMDKHCFTKGDIHAEIYRVNKQLFEDQIMAAMESMYGNNYEDVCIGDEGDDQDEYLELREQRKRELRDAIEQKPHRLCEAVNRMTALRKTDDSSESVKISKPRTTLFHRAFNYIKNLLIALWKRVFNKQ